MASYTPNYNLKKPADADSYDIADANGNMDIIDGALNTLNGNLSNYHTVVTSGIATAQTGFTIMEQRIDKFDNICFLRLRIKAASAVTARSHVATLETAYKPYNIVRCACPCATTYDGYLNRCLNCFILSSDGKIMIDVPPVGDSGAVDININISYNIS